MKILNSDKVIDSLQSNSTVLIKCPSTNIYTIMQVKSCLCGCGLYRILDVQSQRKRVRPVSGSTLDRLDKLKDVLKSKKFTIQ